MGIVCYTIGNAPGVRKAGPRAELQVDVVAGVMAQVDGDLPSAGTHSASYWRHGSEPARSGVGAIRGFGPSRPEKASCYAPHRLSTWRKRGAGWQRRVECSLTGPCQRKEPAPGLNRGLVCVWGWKRNRPRNGGRLTVPLSHGPRRVSCVVLPKRVRPGNRVYTGSCRVV